jgi:mRNA-degrading endonuclease RelE of RelBE toxin-antitoxin system
MMKIEQKIKMLPPELQHEVEDFIEFLIERKKVKSGKKLRQDWAGTLRDFRDQYTSLELQKKSLDWRGD